MTAQASPTQHQHRLNHRMCKPEVLGGGNCHHPPSKNIKEFG